MFYQALSIIVTCCNIFEFAGELMPSYTIIHYSVIYIPYNINLYTYTIWYNIPQEQIEHLKDW